MDARELPARPSLEHYRKEAKVLVKNVKSGDSETIRRVRQHHPQFEKLSESEIRRAPFALTAAHLTLAREHGFESWPRFSRHVEALNRASSRVSKFELAVEAVLSGDETTLETLLRASPELITARSTRRHHATLLHYVGANGVEGYRQKTPKNAVRVAEFLLNAGAEIDAVADMYGGTTTLGLVATSVHPAQAGVQEALMQVLLDRGASFEGAVARDYRAGSLVAACLANGRPEAAAWLADRGAPLNLEAAAGVGHLEAVQRFFTDDGTLKISAEQMQEAFLFACGNGRADIVAFLQQRGASVQASPHGETPLHRAAYGGHPSVVSLLLAKNASIKAKDAEFSGTPLGWALYGWCTARADVEVRREDRCRVVALLVCAGSKVDSEWRWLDEPARGSSLSDKVRADTRMMAALQGNVPD